MFRSLAFLLIGTGISISLFQPSPSRRVPRLIPTNVPAVNTGKNEEDPYLYVSRDGKVRRLYYSSDAPGRPSLFMAEANDKGSWQPGEPLEGPDSDTANITPFLTSDGHDLYFATRIKVRQSDADGRSSENFDIVHSIHVEKGRQFTGPAPIQSVSTPAEETSPWLTADGKQLYFSRKTKDGWRVYLAERPEQ